MITTIDPTLKGSNKASLLLAFSVSGALLDSTQGFAEAGQPWALMFVTFGDGINT